MKFILRLVAVFAVLGLVTLQTSAQTSSAAITGHVVDQSKGVVPNAQVKLVEQFTNVMVTTQTNKNGDFIFNDAQSGTYTVTVTAEGYKELRKVGLVLSASQSLSAGIFTLEVGTVSQSVTVAADITPLQTTSSERSDVLDDKQMDNLLALGRDAFALMRVVPGVVGSEGADSLSTPTTPTVNGVNSEYNSTTFDGAPGNLGGSGKVYTPQNLDSIKEVTLVDANYTAEYGKSAGSNFTFVTKSGTQKFHGGLYEYFRNEDLNANAWFNNYHNISRARYRYNTYGGTIGGPVYWPHHFNTAKNKLFFFASVDISPITNPDGLKYYTIPTQAQINGDFSQTYQQKTTLPQTAATLIHIAQPGQGTQCAAISATPGAGCFPGNIIPSSMINKQMQYLMQVMYNNTLKKNPGLASTDPLSISQNNYNYITNNSAKKPVYQEIFRFDYFPTEQLHMFGHVNLTKVNSNGYSSPANNLPWLMKVNYQNSQPSYVYDVVYTISPTMVNELNLGYGSWSENQIYDSADLAQVTESASGFNLPSLYAGVNPLNLFPTTSFGPTNTANYKWDSRFPMTDLQNAWTGTDHVTKVIGSHTLKAGVDVETNTYLQVNHNRVGTFDTGVSSNNANPNESNFGYSNALLGNLNTFSENTQLLSYKPRQNTLEWYTQDTWNIKNKLTLDYGLRYSVSMGQKLHSGNNFVPSLFSAANAPTLYLPNANGLNGSAGATDPTTGISNYPAAYAGLFVPKTGNLNNGVLYVNTPGYPQGTVYGNGFLAAPRVGFAYSPKSNTVIRGGFGMYYNVQMRNGQEGDLSNNAPTTAGATEYYSSVNSAASNYYMNAGALQGPFGVGHAIALHPNMVYTYNMTLGVQRQFPWGVVGDVAYVGTLGRHLSDYVPINEVPYGAEYQFKNQYVSKVSKGVSTYSTLPDNYFRPYPGFGSISMQNWNLTSNYNALQMKVTRRFHNGLEFGAAYTYSKSMDYTDSYNGTVALYQDLRKWNYGPAGFDLKHILAVNYLYSLPKGSRAFGGKSGWNNFATRGVLDGWQISGIATYYSGAPAAASVSVSNSPNLTGGGDGARPVLTCDPGRKTQGTRTFNKWFDTSCVEPVIGGSVATATTPAVQYSTGNGVFSGKVNYFNPGNTNFDTALFKSVPIENKFTLQLRVETYNTFNHAEFNGVNGGATFANATSQGASNPNTNATFGQLNSAADPRRMQLALRIDF